MTLRDSLLWAGAFILAFGLYQLALQICLVLMGVRP